MDRDLEKVHDEQIAPIMKQFYVTLCQELFGCCIRAEAPSEIALTRYMNKHYGGLWARITEDKPPEQVIGRMLFLNDEDIETIP
jgi:hypothetical protein